MPSAARSAAARTPSSVAVAPASEDAVRTAAARAAEGTNPPSDLNGDAEYKNHVVGVLTRRALLAAAGG